MKRSFLTLLIITQSFLLFSQQPDIAHVISQPLEFNPAYAGSYNQYRGNTYYCTQWIGFEDHPETFKLSAEVPFAKINSGIGLSYISENNGPINSKLYNLSYAYNFKLNNLNLQIGTGLYYNRYKIELSSITFEGYDPVINYYDDKFERLRLKIGAFLYSSNFYFSIAYQDISLYANNSELKYNNEYLNIIAGYHLLKSRNISVSPSVIMNSNFMKIDRLGINVTSTLFSKFWFGLTYYDEYDYLTIGFGINIWKCHGGVRYSNELNSDKGYFNQTYGSFEITTGFYFDKKTNNKYTR